ELINAVEKIYGDLCISRPKSRLNWGIEIPFDKDFVTYVWFDALTNYISFIGYDPSKKDFADQPNEFKDLWPAVQIIGKDILIPAHGIYWMIMLKALGFPDAQMPKFLVHGWWNMSGAKISKSLGNVVDPDELADKYGAGALRYYLMSDIVTGKDSDFSEERLVGQFNTDLANSLGNLLNRTLNMTQKYRDRKVPRPKAVESGPLDEGGISITAWLGVTEFVTAMTDHIISSAYQTVLNLARQCDQFIQLRSPWTLAKDPAEAERLDAVLYTLAETLRIIAILISPVLPKSAHGIFDQLNWKMELSGSEERFSLADAEWGKLPDGHVVGKPTPLFPRIEVASN
ncbi:MAG: class I tRNA ligase family protein, partial [Chthoniobacterales bacterium]